MWPWAWCVDRLELETIIIVSGIAVTLYTLLGGIEAVIWTDAIQSVILTLGAIFVVVLILTGMPEADGHSRTRTRQKNSALATWA